ncbi:MAG: hypothetical protein ABIA37_00365 [Candidatus Woesearchaeota archaeon]
MARIIISARGISPDKLKDKYLLNAMINELAQKLNLPAGSLSLEDVEMGEKKEECQQPNCRAPATATWGGLKVCQDHYEQFKAKQDDDIISMNDY